MTLTRLAALVAFASLPASVPVPAAAADPQDAAAPAPAWKPFQEFAFLNGSWSGTAEGGGRVGGRVSRWSPELSGSYLVQKSNTIFPAQTGQPEEITEEIGYFAYDRDRRKYVATYFFSTGVIGVFDVDFPSDGVVRLVSTNLLNYENGARTRMTMTKKSDSELVYQLEIAASGKDYASFLASKMARK